SASRLWTMSACVGSMAGSPASPGPSGSGKSSLLAVAATLIRADSGRVLIGEGADVIDAAALSSTNAAALRRERIGIVFQQSNLLPALTAREQLLVMAHLGGRQSRAERTTDREPGQRSPRRRRVVHASP
ncbi:ATP-binding cassette domain-containing protein, partial [Propioniciclava flava]